MSDIANMIKTVGVLKKGTVLKIMERGVETAIGPMDKVKWADEDNNAHISLVRRDTYHEVE